MIHRIDRDTSGLLLAAKTRNAHSELSRGFRDRTVKKCYVAILLGSLPTQPSNGLTLPNPEGKEEDQWGLIDSDIDEKSAVTHWKVEESLVIEPANGPRIQLHRVLFRPHTGRKHQLRIHSKCVLGCPILGDPKYDEDTPLAIELRNSGMYLHAYSIEFPHPVTHQWISVQCDPPPKYRELFQLGFEARIFRSIRVAASKFRTKPCVYFLTNSCNKGANCVYKHEKSSVAQLDSLMLELEAT